MARDAMIRMYTSYPAVAALLENAWPVLILFTLFDTMQAMGNSFICAAGKQGLGAIITGSAYFALGIPVAYYLTFG